jgi:hypothetical protein
VVTEEVKEEMDSICAEETLTGGVEPDVLETILNQRDMEDWERSAIRAAILHDAGVGERYLDIPRQDSREGFMDMEEFIETVRDAQLRDRLWNALRQRRPFRRFKDTLASSEVETHRWYAFERNQFRERMERWLRAEGFSVTFVDYPGRSKVVSLSGAGVGNAGRGLRPGLSLAPDSGLGPRDASFTARPVWLAQLPLQHLACRCPGNCV